MNKYIVIVKQEHLRDTQVLDGYRRQWRDCFGALIVNDIYAETKDQAIDIYKLLIKNEIEPTDDNFDKLFKNRLIKKLEEGSIMEGYEIIDAIINNAFRKGDKYEFRKRL